MAREKPKKRASSSKKTSVQEAEFKELKKAVQTTESTRKDFETCDALLDEINENLEKDETELNYIWKEIKKQYTQTRTRSDPSWKGKVERDQVEFNTYDHELRRLRKAFEKERDKLMTVMELRAEAQRATAHAKEGAEKTALSDKECELQEKKMALIAPMKGLLEPTYNSAEVARRGLIGYVEGRIGIKAAQ